LISVLEYVISQQINRTTKKDPIVPKIDNVCCFFFF